MVATENYIKCATDMTESSGPKKRTQIHCRSPYLKYNHPKNHWMIGCFDGNKSLKIAKKTLERF
jgi:hypothetical protein